jgi:hypothetical protein
MSLLAILFWVILVLAAIGSFVPLDTWPHARYFSGFTVIVLFVIVGLKIFRTPLQ